MTIPLIFCVDVEPDPRLLNPDAPEPWVGYEITQRYLRELRPRIEAVTGAPVHYSWFLRIDPQIEPYGSGTWVVDRYPDHMEEIQRAGDEIGVHPHAYRWLESERSWLHDFGNQAWVEHCLTMSIEGFAKALGRACLSLRYGDRWLNTATVNLADRLGIRFDLTVEPGTLPYATPSEGERASGPLPDYRRVPRVPYTPSRWDFRRADRRDARSIREIPLTSSYFRLGFHPRQYLRRLRANGVRGRRQNRPLYMWESWPTPNTFERLLDRALAAQRRPYLAFAIRTRPDIREAIGARVETLLAHPVRSRFRFSTPAEALAELERAR
jgi:peptidoglycan/xylan/chitin deacetylase (PgdA/CDA1 family)